MYECKLAESSFSDYCAIYFVAHCKFDKPFLKEYSRKLSTSRLGSSKKDRWMSILESALESSQSKENSSFISRINSCSALRELQKDDS